MTLTIEQDTAADSPASWGDKSLFLGVLNGHRSWLGVLPLATWDRAFWRFAVIETRRDGIRMAETAHEMRGCPLVIQASRTEWPTLEGARKAAEGLADAWNQYLTGEVYGYVVKEGDTVIDSCWGHYGDDTAREAGREALAHFEANSDHHIAS